MPVSGTTQHERDALNDALTPLFDAINPTLEQLAKEQPEGWQQQYTEGLQAAMDEAERILVGTKGRGGLLDALPNLFTEQEMHPISEAEKGGPVAEGDYRKIELTRDDAAGYIVYGFVFGAKSSLPPELAAAGIETPSHEHSGPCASAVYQGSTLETLFAPDEDGVPRAHTARINYQNEMQRVGPDEGEHHDRHTIANPSPTDPAITIHVYPLRVIQEDKLMDYTGPTFPFPPTAVNITAEAGRPDPTSHMRDDRGETALSVRLGTPSWQERLDEEDTSKGSKRTTP